MDKHASSVIEEDCDKNISSKNKIKGRFSSVITSLRGTERHELIYDLLMFAVGFLLSRCHLVFGAHPLGLAFVSSLSSHIWPTLFGSVIGALSLGARGVIFAAVTAIAVFLRAAISSSDKNCDGIKTLFQEALMLRLSVSIICGFISAVYEMLLSDFRQESLIFGVTMILTAPVMTFIFNGLSLENINLKSLIFEKTNDFSQENESKQDKYNRILFYISALMLVFFIGMSFRGVSILGISLSYVFSSITTLLVAKRFGGIFGMAVGFASSLGISGILSVAFALAGLSAGIMFSFGTAYAIVAGGLAICSWSIYSSGLGGLLSTLPEYLVSAIAGIPLFSAVKESEKKEEEKSNPHDDALDMIGTMALAYQNKYSGNLNKINLLLSGMSKIVNDFSDQEEPLSIDDYRDIVIGIAECHCVGCPGAGFCTSEDVRPCIKNADKIASMLYLGKRITGNDVNTETEFCQMSLAIAESINREAGQAFLENQKKISLGSSGEDYKLISKLVENAIAQDEIEKRIDNTLTAPLTEVIKQCDMDGAVRVFGKRRKHFLIAAEDPTGSKITSAELAREIEKATEVRLGAPEYFRKGEMALMECSIKPKLRIEWATASRSGHEEEISGDSCIAFHTDSDMFYGVISDGMGSGRAAKETSEFVSDILRTAMAGGADKETIIHLLNRTIKSRREECSATVDLLEADLLNGEAVFIKSGAAPSYVKRESSIFRIRSQTAPIGLMAGIDTEKTKISVKAGDYIIMLSDGIAEEGDEAAWLLLLLGEAAKENPDEYAALILSEAIMHNGIRDDMTVLVIKISSAE